MPTTRSGASSTPDEHPDTLPPPVDFTSPPPETPAAAINTPLPRAAPTQSVHPALPTSQSTNPAQPTPPLLRSRQYRASADGLSSPPQDHQPLLLTPAVLGQALSAALHPYLPRIRESHEVVLTTDDAPSSPPPAAHAQHRGGFRPVPPPLFSGNRRVDQTDVDGFLLQCELYFSLAGLPENDDTRVLAAASRLTGTALSWWRGNRHNIAGLAYEWPTFYDSLAGEFRAVDDARDAREVLYSLRERNLTVSALINEFTRQLPRISDIGEGELLHLFTHSLPQDVRPHVLTQRPRSFTEAKRLASLAASTMAPLHRSRRPPQRAVANNTHRILSAAAAPPRASTVAALPYLQDQATDDAETTAVTDVAAVAAGRRFPPPLTPTERQRLMSTGGCFRCRQPGHQGSACPVFGDQGNGPSHV